MRFTIKRGGFTLIELLVVVGIIALLTAITMPAFAEARRISKKTVCLHNLQQIGTAIQSYLHNNQDTFPPDIALMPIQSPPPLTRKRTLPQMLKRELAAMGGQRTATGEEAEYVNKVFECPADRITDEGLLADPLVGGVGPRYFDSQKTSYEWNDQLNKKKIQFNKKIVFLEFFDPAKNEWVKIEDQKSKVVMVKDFDPFHGTPNQKGSLNILHADLEPRSH